MPAAPFEHRRPEGSGPGPGSEPGYGFEPTAYRFGPFEVLVESGTLLRRGERIRIEDLPLRMLLVLLKRPRQLVPREELRAKLWGENTFGASDNRLNVAAAKLREALYDPASGSAYIETIRGKGYVFVSEVTEERIATGAPIGAGSGTGVASAPGPVPLEFPAPVLLPEPVLLPAMEEKFKTEDKGGWLFAGRQRTHGWIIASVAAILTVAAACPLLLVWWHGRPLITPQGKVMIGRFINSTGDDAFSGIMQPALRYKLEESPYLSFVSYRELRGQLKDPNTASVAEELRACQALGAKVLVDGEITLGNPGYELRVNARRCGDNKLLATEKTQAANQSLTLTALGNVIQQMRGRLGESASSLQRFNVPLAQATTASLAALKAFSDGEQRRLQGQETEAISDYKLSVDLDPQFALAYARMGTIYENLGEHLLSRQHYQRAFELRERTTDRERLYIASHYYSSATGEIERAIQAQELWRTLYPRDMTPANNLAIEYLALGQMQKAIETAKVAQNLDSSSGIAYATLAAAYLRSGNYAALTPFCLHPAANADSPPIHSTCFLLAFTRGDQGAMKTELDWARRDPAGSELLEEAAWTAAFGGQMTRAGALFSEARESALENGLKEFAAQIDADRADLTADLGDHAQARQYALRALELAPDSVQVQAYAALALARIGDTARAETEAAKAAAQSPRDTILQSAQLAAVKAAIALDRHNPTEAIRALEDSVPYDLCSAMSLAPAYYRGLALLEARQPADAAREFQKVVEHRALAPDSPYVPLSYLELSRAMQMLGNSKRASEAANEVKAIWKNADRGFAPLRELPVGN